jgi:hypothetical protein
VKTTREEVIALRDKIEDKRAGVNKFITNAEHERWYRHGLEVQEASFDYFIKEINRVLESTEG